MERAVILIIKLLLGCVCVCVCVCVYVFFMHRNLADAMH